MSLYGTVRSGDRRIAALVIALADGTACALHRRCLGRVLGPDRLARPHPSGAGTGEAPDALGMSSARQLAFELGSCVVTTGGKLACSNDHHQLGELTIAP